MNPETRELYASPNGDVWHLVREARTGRVFVRHRANARSGGQTTDTEIEEFLRRGGEPPEKQALMGLAGKYFD